MERRAVALNPDLADAHAWLGGALLDLGQVDEPLRRSTRGCVWSPRTDRRYQALGRALGRERRFRRGDSRLPQTIELNPEAGYSYLQLGLLLAWEGQYAEAEAVCRRAVELQDQDISGNAGLQVVGANARLGYVFYLQGRYEEASANMSAAWRSSRRAITRSKESTSIEITMNIGAAYLRMGKAEEAARFFDRALKSFDARVAKGADDPYTRYYIACLLALRATKRRRSTCSTRLRPTSGVDRRPSAARPRFDGLRGRPRFEAITTRAQPMRASPHLVPAFGLLSQSNSQTQQNNIRQFCGLIFSPRAQSQIGLSLAPTWGGILPGSLQAPFPGGACDPLQLSWQRRHMIQLIERQFVRTTRPLYGHLVSLLESAISAAICRRDRACRRSASWHSGSDQPHHRRQRVPRARVTRVAAWLRRPRHVRVRRARSDRCAVRVARKDRGGRASLERLDAARHVRHSSDAEVLRSRRASRRSIAFPIGVSAGARPRAQARAARRLASRADRGTAGAARSDRRAVRRPGRERARARGRAAGTRSARALPHRSGRRRDRRASRAILARFNRSTPRAPS